MKRRPGPSLQLTSLENREVPATLLPGNKAITFLDTDGDIVTVALSKAIPSGTDVNTIFTFDTGTVDGSNANAQVLQEIDLTALGSATKGVNVTVSATKADKKTKSTADIGFVNATGIDIGSVTVAGDLGRVVAGNTVKPATGVTTLKVDSLGKKGLTTQANGGDLISFITGNLTTLDVSGDIDQATVKVDQGNLTTVKVGGKLIGGAADQSGSILLSASSSPITRTITRTTPDPFGEDPFVETFTLITGYKVVGGNIGNVTIGGGLQGAAGVRSGTIGTTLGNIGPVKITGGLTGGTAMESGSVFAISRLFTLDDGDPITDEEKTVIFGGNIGNLTVVGNLTGGSQERSGSVFTSFGNIGSVKVSGNLIGGAGLKSGSIIAEGQSQGVVKIVRYVDFFGFLETYSIISTYKLVGGAIGAINILGNLTGGDGKQSGSVGSNQGSLGIVNVTGNILGAVGEDTGAIFAKSKTESVAHEDSNHQPIATDKLIPLGGSIGAVKVDGNVTGGNGKGSGSISANQGNMTSVKIGGNLVGGVGENSGSIQVGGNATPVFGSIRFQDLEGGFFTSVGVTNYTLVGGVLGPVTINGSIIGGDGKRSASIGSTLGNVGKVTVAGKVVNKVLTGGDITGGVGEESGTIFAKTSLLDTEVTVIVDGIDTFKQVYIGGKIDSLSVAGNVTGGTGFNSASSLADLSINSVTVGKNWTAANIVVGKSAGPDQIFDNDDDTITLEIAPKAINKIGSITIKGTVEGTAGSQTDGYRFTARKIDSLKIGSTPNPLKTNLDDDIALGTNGDFRLVEFIIPVIN